MPRMGLTRVETSLLNFRTGGVSCYTEGKTCKLIVSSCVLQNICLTRGIPLSTEDEYFRDNTVLPNEEGLPDLTPATATQLGSIFRDELAEKF
jgi:hypothetical protein